MSADDTRDPATDDARDLDTDDARDLDTGDPGADAKHELAAADHTAAGDAPPVPAVVFLSGSRRGDMVPLGAERVTIGTDPATEVRLPDDTEPLPLPVHVTLERRGRTYEMVAEVGAEVWVNGEAVDRMVLASGDVLEVGRDGAILRFRLYPPDRLPYKSLGEIFDDCIECVRAERGPMRKAKAFATLVPRELATRSTRRFRALTVAAIALMSVVTAMTARRDAEVEERLLSEIERIEGLAAFLEGARSPSVAGEELGDIVERLEATADRVEALEAMTGAGARVIADAVPTILFLQGSYHFVEPATERPLRMVPGSDGRPVRNTLGHPALSLDGDGPPLEIFVTGTGFVVTRDGIAATNRHVARPWEFDEAARAILESGFEARWGRLQAFFSGAGPAHAIHVVAASDSADAALVQLESVQGPVPYVTLAERPPSPGEAVIVMGYPLGLRALMARSDPGFVAGLRREAITDFFEQAERVSEAGFMQPLATSGIVGQVTAARIVYDAETTSGGSGGPVLDLSGRVVAVNAATMPQFGGSNLGVPVSRIVELMKRVERQQP